MRIGVYVVDVATVDADRGEDACVGGDTWIAGENFSVVKEDGATGVTAFDGAVEVIPLVDPANASGRVLNFVDAGKGLAKRDFSGKCKCAIKNAAFVLRGNDYAVLFVDLGIGDPEAVGKESGRGIELRFDLME